MERLSSPSAGPGSSEVNLPPEYRLADGNPDYLRLILTSKVYEVLHETPLTRATNLSNRMEREVLLKREDLTPVHSFKLRGAYNKLANLPKEERWRGVIACSAGNHAQGVAYSARHLKIPATIVMPKGTPAIKHNNVSRLGGTVVLSGDDYDGATKEARRLETLHGLTNVHPFDDPYVIAGQGTVGMEILRQTDLDELEAVFVCVGGGGLISGVGVYIRRIAPHVKIIGVEASDAAAMHDSLQAGHSVVLSDVGLFADGAAVRSPGRETLRLCRECVDEIITVSTDEICAAIKDVFEDTRSILEPAGALAVAGLKRYASRERSKERMTRATLCAIASGANMNFDRLRFVADRAAIGEGREALLLCRIPEGPGSFAMFISLLPEPSIAITEFSYRYSNSDHAEVLMAITVPTPARATILNTFRNRLQARNMSCEDISDNEIAKTHLRFMIGGHMPIKGERLLSFEFPERPGALKRFLHKMRPGFSISLFHYRNVGGDVAKILCGLQIPEPRETEGSTERSKLTSGLDDRRRDFNGDHRLDPHQAVATGDRTLERTTVKAVLGKESTHILADSNVTENREQQGNLTPQPAMAELKSFLQDLGYPWRDETHDRVYQRLIR